MRGLKKVVKAGTEKERMREDCLILAFSTVWRGVVINVFYGFQVVWMMGKISIVKYVYVCPLSPVNGTGIKERQD